ncbi:MAG: 50S ribosome-binding GTPase [Phycisphaeraceae bacterium]|nr:50S ribosome-binding GTPase [Phycisphaeraceae bacterium]
MNAPGDTILAIASAPGWSARAIIRASGPGSAALLNAIVDEPIPARRGVYVARAKLSGDGPALAVLVLRFVGPRSYTGEDSFEIQCPGNPLLIERLMNRLLTLSTPAPTRQANPGEFTARAFLNGRIRMEQAEGVAAMVAARSAEQADAARRLLTGETGHLHQAWADEALGLLALVEAGIDFTDQEDVIPIDAESLDRRLGAIEQGIRDHVGDRVPRAISAGIPAVALVGSPSAGKSTLFNALLGRERSVTAAEPGTTRDVVRESLDLSRDIPGGGAVDLIDLPGLDRREDGVVGKAEAAAQRAARESIAASDVILHCDPSGRFLPDKAIPSGATVIRVRTKADLPADLDEPGDDGHGAIAVCALDGWRLGPLRRAIADATTLPGRFGADAGLIPRHRRSLAQAADAITRARKASRDLLRDPAVVAESLRLACDALSDLTGRVSPDDVLGRIFATFCVGK